MIDAYTILRTFLPLYAMPVAVFGYCLLIKERSKR